MTVEGNSASVQVPPPNEIVDKVGPSLRARREQLGWDLNDVASWLRIRLSYLQALEEGRTTDIPGNAYALGFLRTYAAALGFDPEDMAGRFKRETRGIENKPELTFPAPVPDRGIPTGVVVLLGGICVIGAYVGWYKFSDHQQIHSVAQYVPPVADVMPGVTARSTTSPQIATMIPAAGKPPQADASAPPVPSVQSLPPQGGAVQPVPPAAAIATTEPEASPSAAANDAPQSLKPTTATSMAGPGGSTPSDSSPGQSAPTITESPVTSAGNQVTGSMPTTASAPAADPNQITLHAGAATWVQIKGADGHVAYDHVMNTGDSWPVPLDGGPYKLTVGNAGGLTLEGGGVTTAVLGRAGSVRRNIVLDVATIKDGSVLVAPLPAKTQRESSPPPPTGDVKVPQQGQ